MKNPVKKNMDKFTRPSVVPDKKKEQKKGSRKHKKKEVSCSLAGCRW